MRVGKLGRTLTTLRRATVSQPSQVAHPGGLADRSDQLRTIWMGNEAVRVEVMLIWPLARW